jgi:hypothetical protein
MLVSLSSFTGRPRADRHVGRRGRRCGHSRRRRHCPSACRGSSRSRGSRARETSPDNSAISATVRPASSAGELSDELAAVARLHPARLPFEPHGAGAEWDPALLTEDRVRRRWHSVVGELAVFRGGLYSTGGVGSRRRPTGKGRRSATPIRARRRRRARPPSRS